MLFFVSGAALFGTTGTGTCVRSCNKEVYNIYLVYDTTMSKKGLRPRALRTINTIIKHQYVCTLKGGDHFERFFIILLSNIC